jgi:hypothetical protein
MQLAFGVTCEQDGVLAHIVSDKIVRLGYLRLVPDVEPATPEDLLQLLGVQFLIYKDSSVEMTLGIINKASHSAGHVLLLNGRMWFSDYHITFGFPMPILVLGSHS